MVGDTVNLASRIQGLNKGFGNDILISAITVERLVDDIDIEVEKQSATTVKGKRNPVEVYKLVQAFYAGLRCNAKIVISSSRGSLPI